MVHSLKESEQRKYCRYEVTTKPYKDGFTKIDVVDNYWDKSDYAFVDLETGEIKSYNDVALNYVINVLKSAGMSMYDVKPKAKYKFYTEPHSSKVIDTELVEAVLVEGAKVNNTKTMLELQSEEIDHHLSNIEDLNEILDSLSEFEVHLVKAKHYCESLKSTESPDVDEATFLQEVLNDIRDDINCLGLLSSKAKTCAVELLNVVDNIDKACGEIIKEN